MNEKPGSIALVAIEIVTFNFGFGQNKSVQKNQAFILFIAATVIIVLIIVGVYLLLSPNVTDMSDMMNPTSTTNNGAVALTLILAAIILSVALIVYFYYSKNQKPPKKVGPPLGNKQSFSSQVKAKIPQTSQASCASLKPYDVFLCYKKSSARDYADHLKAGLEELGLHTFEDCKDIPQTVEPHESWSEIRDRAITESRFFVLIMTPGFGLSSEVIREIATARKLPNKTYVFFRHRSMGHKIVVNLGDEILDIGQLEQVSFETKEELLRLAHNILLKAKSP